MLKTRITEFFGIERPDRAGRAHVDCAGGTGGRGGQRRRDRVHDGPDAPGAGRPAGGDQKMPGADRQALRRQPDLSAHLAAAGLSGLHPGLHRGRRKVYRNRRAQPGALYGGHQDGRHSRDPQMHLGAPCPQGRKDRLRRRQHRRFRGRRSPGRRRCDLPDPGAPDAGCHLSAHHRFGRVCRRPRTRGGAGVWGRTA